KTKLAAILLTLLFVTGVLAACGGSAPPTTGTTTTPPASGGDTTTPAATTPAVPEPKVFRFYNTIELPSLNTHDVVETHIDDIMQYLAGRLYRRYPDADGRGFTWGPDLADGMPEQIDDYTWRIKVRKDATWSNGEAIDANSFMYSFKMLLDPIMANRNADGVAVSAITIVNAQEYARQAGEGQPAVDWEDVGIKQIDDYTIEITTRDPNTVDNVCDGMSTRGAFPVNEGYYEAGMNAERTDTSYANDAASFIGSGPYTLTSWEYGSKYVLAKRPDHWLADKFHYDSVEWYMIPEANAQIELWEKGELEYLRPLTDTIGTYIDDPRMHQYDTLYVYHVDLNGKNPSNPLSGILEYRKALYHAINRKTLGWDVFGYMKGSGTYVNGQAGILSPDGLTYRESTQGQAVTQMVESWGPDADNPGYNPELAREYLAKAYEIAGLPDDAVVTVIFAHDEEDYNRATGEYLQEEFNKIFEGKIKLDLVLHAGMSGTDFKKTGDDKWDLAPNEWQRTGARYFPYQVFFYYTERHYPTGPNNYYVEAFEDQYDIADASDLKADYGKMLDETKKLEEMYLDYVIHIPLVQDIRYELFSDKVKLPMEIWMPGINWGEQYGDIVQ
ncbi:MAG: ABC transporter substrate-binding protein, partial [Peptococcaceae bacterium]|nr:ABC transporter substrate-binding protein [Peptococcaceae bacterium]